MRIKAKWSNRVYCCGDLATVCVSVMCKDVVNTKIRAMAHCYINNRWYEPSLFNPNSVFLQEFDNPAVTTEPPKSLFCPLDSWCIFVTSTLQFTLSNTSIFQFYLPENLLPSYKGVGFAVSYVLEVCVDSINGPEFVHFPFVVGGPGIAYSSRKIVYSPLIQVNNNAMTTMTHTRLHDQFSADKPVILHLNDDDNDGSTVFKVRSEGLVCSIKTYPSYHHSGVIGYFIDDSMDMWFDFSGAEQICDRVKIRLSQYEMRSDDAHLQIREIFSEWFPCLNVCTKHCVLRWMDRLAATAVFPMGRVEYKLELEFYLSDSEDGHDATWNGNILDPLEWTLPIVLKHKSSLACDGCVEALKCMDDAAFTQVQESKANK